MDQRTRLQNTLDRIVEEGQNKELQLMRTALLITFGAGLVLGVLVTLLVIG